MIFTIFTLLHTFTATTAICSSNRTVVRVIVTKIVVVSSSSSSSRRRSSSGCTSSGGKSIVYTILFICQVFLCRQVSKYCKRTFRQTQLTTLFL